MSSLDCELCGEAFKNVELLRHHSIACKNKHCPTCSVCFEASGRMTKCSQCQVSAHPNCLGLRCIHSSNTFKCEPCNELQDPSTIKCELCPNYGGILIPVQDKLNQWVHISCSLWLPNIILSNTNNKLYANISNLNTSKANNNPCIHCNVCTGKQLFCLICGIHCHVTCCSDSNFLLKMVPLQPYILWDTSRVCLWLKHLKLYSLIDTFNKYNIDGLSLGELSANNMQNILNIPSHQILTLQTEIRKIQQINLNNLGAQQYQTLRCVWSLCGSHRTIPFSQAMFIKLWNKNNISVHANVSSGSGSSDEGASDAAGDDEEDEPKCMGCGGTTDEEHFLLCDNDSIAEKHGAHLYCLSPPLASIPKHDWFCPSCSNTKYISKACLYCNSKMYNLNKKNLIHCKKCSNICHYNCGLKVNDIEHNMRWKCPQCLNKKVIKLMHKNNKLLLANNTSKSSTVKKKNYINWNLFEIIEANELCSVGQSCKKYREKKKHYHCKDTNCVTRNGTPWFSERINSVEIHQQKHTKKSKFKHKNKTRLKLKIKHKKSQFIETESENENDMENETELHSDTDIIKIPKYKNKNNKLVDEHHGILHTFLQTANSDNISMRRRASSINKYILDRTNEFSKSIITQWIKQHRGDEKLSIWLQKAMVKLTNPKIENKSKKDAEKLIIDILAVISKAKILRIDWTPRSKLLDIITSIINNSRLNLVIIRQAKQCKLLFPSSLFINKMKAKKKSNVVSSKRVLKSNSKNVFDPCFEEDMHLHSGLSALRSGIYEDEDGGERGREQRICIKMKDFVGGKELDWHEIIYGRYGSIKTEHEQKYNVAVTLRDGVNDGKALKPGFDVNKYHKLYVVVVGENRRQIGEAVDSYRRIIDKTKERNRDRYHDRDRERSRNRNRERERDRDRKKRDREHRSRDRHRHRDRDRDRERDRDRYYERHRHRDKDKDKDRDKHKDKVVVEEKETPNEIQKDVLDPRKVSINAQKADKQEKKAVDMKEILWLRVQSNNNFGDIEYYFWNRITNETSWSEPKLWKDYEMESSGNANGNGNGNSNKNGGIMHSLESVLSSADQHLQTIINSKEDEELEGDDEEEEDEDVDTNEDIDVDVGEDDATKELLKLTSEFNKEIDDIEMTNNSLGHQLNVATDYLNTLKRQQNKTENESSNSNINGINLYESLSQSVKKRRDISTASSNSSAKSKRARKKSLRESISSSDSTQSLYGYDHEENSNNNKSKRNNKRENKHRDRDRNRNRNRERERDRSRDRNKNNQNNNSTQHIDDRSYGHKDRQRRNHRKYDRR